MNNNYTNKIHYEINDAVNISVWLEGEVLDAEPQLGISFRRISGKYVASLDFQNVSDGVDFDSLDKISSFVQAYRDKLEALHAVVE